MAFSFKALTQWIRGTVLAGQSDDVPQDGLRRSRNVRIDRIRGTLATRFGMTRKTSGTLGGTILWIAKLFGLSADFSYAHIGGSVYRHTDAWGTQTSIGSAGATTIVNAAIMPDGATTPVPHMYFTCTAG